MIKHICLAVALAIAPAGAAWAHGTSHHHHARHARTSAMHSDAKAIDRCANMHYGEKVACLHQARGDAGHYNAMGTGGTISTAGGTLSMTMGPEGVRTPSQSNETQPGLMNGAMPR